MWSNYVYVQIAPSFDLIFDELWENWKLGNLNESTKDVV